VFNRLLGKSEVCVTYLFPLGEALFFQAVGTVEESKTKGFNSDGHFLKIENSQALKTIFLFSSCVVAMCGLGYELVGGTIASYLIGDSVKQFSFVIGFFMFAMGLGALAVQKISSTKKNLESSFIQLEISLSLFGGLFAPVQFLLFKKDLFGQLSLYLFLVVIGMLVGAEIPLLLRLLKERLSFEKLISVVLGLDYIGALLASLLFPLILVPMFGVLRTGVLFGILNLSIAFLILWYWDFSNKKKYYLQCILTLVILMLCFLSGNEILKKSESNLLSGNVVYAKNSPYQRIVITRDDSDTRLFLNNHLQFSSIDEHRYHESLVHIVMSSAPKPPQKVLIFGGGDGMAAREVLKHSSVEKIVLVDLDEAVTNLFQTSELLVKMNQKSLMSEKLQIINADAFQWLEKNDELFDVAIIDFPDPNSFSVGKLYSTKFFETLQKTVKYGFSVQSTSPMYSKKAFWCIDNTIQASDYYTLPYHVNVPAFGEWGFVLATKKYISIHQIQENLQAGLVLKYLSSELIPSLFVFPKDMQKVKTEVNTLMNQELVQLYDYEWKLLENE
jgi:spermidine synthase